MAQTFNISDAVANPDLLENATFTLSRPLAPEERTAKISRENWNLYMGHARDIAISLFALVCAGIFVYICVSLIFSTTASADDKKWATSLITLMASGVIGYLTGKASKGPEK